MTSPREAGGRKQEAGIRRQEGKRAGGQEAGSRRQEAGTHYSAARSNALERPYYPTKKEPSREKISGEREGRRRAGQEKSLLFLLALLSIGWRKLVLPPGEFGFSQIPESLRLLNSGSFVPLDFCLFLSSMHLLHLMGEAGPSRVLETHLTMCDK